MEKIYSVEGYTLKKVIGEGTYATVFLAQEHKTGLPCAVKIVYKGNRGKRGTKHAQKEIEGLKRLGRVPGVVHLKEWREDLQMFYIIMNFLEGVSLESFPLAGDVLGVLHVSRALLGILQEVHSKGVYHLDLKPANILVCAEGPCLLDFGCSFVSGVPVIEKSALPFDGTPAYMAPEMVDTSQKPVSVNLEALDVWSFGCLLYYITTGKEAFTASSLYSLYPKIRDCEVDYTEVPEEIRKLCLSALVFSPHGRKTVQALAKDIDVLLEEKAQKY
ncbi:hypothetical protein NECID01_0992 [Nematocida sp. AWRm77]|nr:hypothetical protein NECID01_0992 [Nematocida sp. AWRm77]